jgi:peptidoglycan/xylan/chitin deacetylase (PgdA/CDA1 family)
VTKIASPQVPILMYHDIGQSSETTSRLAVSPSAFAGQLAYLHDAGFKTITMGDLSAVLAGEITELPDQTIVLTFDDGYESFYSHAVPLLGRYGFTATVFVTSGWVHDAGTRPTGKEPGRMLGWNQVTESVGAGIEIGAHTCQHPELDQLPDNSLREELYSSKARLEDKIGLAVPGQAYPFGYSNARVRQVARDVGYGYGCAVSNAMAARESDLFAVPRLTIQRSTTLTAFHQLVHGHVTMTLLRDRALTKGWAVPRRARGMLNRISREM